jgi:hypothetical protein
MAEELRRPFEKFMDSPYYSIYIFEKWVERCKKCFACQERYFEKGTVTAPPSCDSGNKVSPRTFQMTLVVAPPSQKKGGSFKMTVTQTLTTVRGMKITPLLRYPHQYNLV